MATPAEIVAQSLPPMPTLSAQWAPIYLEPIPGSGERLTVAIAARADDEQHLVVRTLDAKKAQCMYGPNAPSMLGFVDLIVDSLQSHLETGAALQDWRPPLRDTVSIGDINVGYGDRLEEVIEAGTMLAASLAMWSPGQENAEAAENQDPDSDVWARQIREGIVSVRNEFAPRFHQKVALRRGAPATSIGYLGDRLAAQFGRLVPGRGMTPLRNRAKAYITELQMLRDLDAGSFLKRPYYELLLWLPVKDSPAYSDQQHSDVQGAFAELEEFGDRQELRIEAFHESAPAVRRILSAEEAR